MTSDLMMENPGTDADKRDAESNKNSSDGNDGTGIIAAAATTSSSTITSGDALDSLVTSPILDKIDNSSPKSSSLMVNSSSSQNNNSPTSNLNSSLDNIVSKCNNNNNSSSNTSDQLPQGSSTSSCPTPVNDDSATVESVLGQLEDGLSQSMSQQSVSMAPSTPHSSTAPSTPLMSAALGAPSPCLPPNAQSGSGGSVGGQFMTSPSPQHNLPPQSPLHPHHQQMVQQQQMPPHSMQQQQNQMAPGQMIMSGNNNNSGPLPPMSQLQGPHMQQPGMGSGMPPHMSHGQGPPPPPHMMSGGGNLNYPPQMQHMCPPGMNPGQNPGMNPNMMGNPGIGGPGPIRGSSSVHSGDSQYMSQQSHIFVFSTQLANQAADAVNRKMFPNINEYHKSLPETRDFLTKHPTKPHQFSRANNAFLNNFCSRTGMGPNPRTGNPNMIRMQGGQMPPGQQHQQQQQLPPHGQDPNFGPNPNFNPNFGPPPNWNPNDGNPNSPWPPNSTSPRFTNSPSLMSGGGGPPFSNGPNNGFNPNFGGPDFGPMMSGPGGGGGPPGMKSDEELTPEQRQHREEKLRQLGALRQQLGIDGQPGGPRPNYGPGGPPPGCMMRQPGPPPGMCGPGGMMSGGNNGPRMSMNEMSGHPSHMNQGHPGMISGPPHPNMMGQGLPPGHPGHHHPGGHMGGPPPHGPLDWMDGPGGPGGMPPQVSAPPPQAPAASTRGGRGRGRKSAAARAAAAAQQAQQQEAAAQAAAMQMVNSPGGNFVPGSPSGRLSGGPPPPYHSGPGGPRPGRSPHPSSPATSGPMPPNPSPRMQSPADARQRHHPYSSPGTPCGPESMNQNQQQIKFEQTSPQPGNMMMSGGGGRRGSSHPNSNPSPMDGMSIKSESGIKSSPSPLNSSNMKSEPQLMPVPSPQHIQYLNAFDGQELTIQKQPNTSLRDSELISPPDLDLSSVIGPDFNPSMPPNSNSGNFMDSGPPHPGMMRYSSPGMSAMDSRGGGFPGGPFGGPCPPDHPSQMMSSNPNSHQSRFMSPDSMQRMGHGPFDGPPRMMMHDHGPMGPRFNGPPMDGNSQMRFHGPPPGHHDPNFGPPPPHHHPQHPGSRMRGPPPQSVPQRFPGPMGGGPDGSMSPFGGPGMMSHPDFGPPGGPDTVSSSTHLQKLQTMTPPFDIGPPSGKMDMGTNNALMGGPNHGQNQNMNMSGHRNQNSFDPLSSMANIANMNDGPGGQCGPGMSLGGNNGNNGPTSVNFNTQMSSMQHVNQVSNNGPNSNPNNPNFGPMGAGQNVGMVGGPQTVNNTYVNANLSIQQLNIQHPGPNYGPNGPPPNSGPMGHPGHMSGMSGNMSPKMSSGGPQNGPRMSPANQNPGNFPPQMGMPPRGMSPNMMGGPGGPPPGMGYGPPPNQMGGGGGGPMGGPRGRGGNPNNPNVSQVKPNTIQYHPPRGAAPGPNMNPGQKGPPNLDFLNSLTNPENQNKNMNNPNNNNSYFGPKDGPGQMGGPNPNMSMGGMSGPPGMMNSGPGRPQLMMRGNNNNNSGPPGAPGPNSFNPGGQMMNQFHPNDGFNNSRRGGNNNCGPPPNATLMPQGQMGGGGGYGPPPGMSQGCPPSMSPGMMSMSMDQHGNMPPSQFGGGGGPPMGPYGPKQGPPQFMPPGNHNMNPNDPNYAQQYQNFQQQLYATGNNGPNQGGPGRGPNQGMPMGNNNQFYSSGPPMGPK